MIDLSTVELGIATVAEAARSHRELLHPWELSRFSAISSAARRDTFVAGRCAAKSLLTQQHSVKAEELAILSWDRAGRGVAPHVWLDGCLLPGHLSIAHDDVQAIACWSEPGDPRRGIDILPADATLRPSTTIFSNSELQHLHRLPTDQRDRMAACWFSAKEAAFKAVGAGSFRPRLLHVHTDGGALAIHINTSDLHAASAPNGQLERGATIVVPIEQQPHTLITPCLLTVATAESC